MSKYFMIMFLTALGFRLFVKKLNWLLKKRTHSDYLFIASMSACQLAFITGLYVLALAFLVGVTTSVCRTNGAEISLINNLECVMKYTFGCGLIILMSSASVPFFFIKQIEVTEDGAAIDGEIVSWSLKRPGNQKDSACYIQVHTRKRKGLYMVVNVKTLSQVMKKEIILDSQRFIPSARREKHLIDILNIRKKDSTLKLSIRAFITAIVVTIGIVSTAFIIV